MDTASIIAVYIALYALLMSLGYYMTLPYYNRKVQLRTGMTFDEQWAERRYMGEKLMRIVSMVWGVLTGVILVVCLIVPFKTVEERPKLVSIFQVQNQSATIVIADGRVFKLEYSESHHLKGKPPGMFLSWSANAFGWKLSGNPLLKINEYVEDPDEPISIGDKAISQKAAGKN